MRRLAVRPAGRAKGRVWLGIAAACAALVAAHLARADVGGEATAGEPAVVTAPRAASHTIVYAPRGEDGEASSARPIAVMLHGMCDTPENECPYFAGAVNEKRWLLCPRATVRCEGGGTMWDWKRKIDTIEASIADVEAAYPGRLETAHGRTLIGFSLGALAAVDVAHRGEGRWSGVVLIGAKVRPDARLLKRAGVKSVLFASGERDMMRGHMMAEARRLDRHGIRATYRSLGKVGHWFAPDMQAFMNDALAWIEAGDARDADEAEAAPVAAR